MVFVNDDDVALSYLRKCGLDAEAMPGVPWGDWETDAIHRHGIQVWINDRLNTEARHGRAVRAAGAALATFDDRGPGAAYAHVHIAALLFDDDNTTLGGDRVYDGTAYLVLDDAIERFRRPRTALNSLVVTLGGSDTYGVTVKVVEELERRSRTATIVLGPSFRHDAALNRVLTPAFSVMRNVPSLAEEFARHDLAITGGGLTPFEAQAAGLPCIIVANEDFEIPVAMAIEAGGGARFAGHHSNLNLAALDADLPLAEMSWAAMAFVPPGGTSRVASLLTDLAGRG